ncbi:hypothetical protein, partial [Bacillus subtilis]|uniref:hypothetical protein n=1 Tax=Bacillus subtilis TaxID=1423 RepID=UPI003C1F62B5
VRRELLCEFVTETTRQVTPEFSRARNIWDDTTFTERPMFSDLLLGMDLGHVDLTHVLFAWYHFESATLYVEDEWVSQYAR